ncbi:MAG: hypothetical protein K0Q66_2476, partial [Chitinophagaceae bacterium]|nr:hypothetical protein [Chitinophagaceae bacterium]
TYQYEVSINGGPGNIKGEVTTQPLWQYRKPPPDFSFIAGSCTYFNEPVYDRPGKPYGGDSSIFETMAKENSDFMLWLGDNWYTREVDYFSEWGLHYRAAHFKRQPVLRPLFKKMAHYAIWDDHDYGWNNSDKSYPLKATSREVFMKNWSNPSYGENGEGIYTKFTWNDVDVFLLDDRWFRTNDDMPDSIGGKPTEKKMYGDKQMEWLKNALLQSNYNRNVSYRLIVTGSQVLNPLSPFDKFSAFKTEYNDFMNFITASKINGVVFLSGDRHHSEIIKVEREGSYPLFDVTSSPLTSGISRSAEIEKNNPYLVGQQVNVQNYTRFSFSGPIENRKMTVEFLGIKGEKLGEWSVLLKAVSVAK